MALWTGPIRRAEGRLAQLLSDNKRVQLGRVNLPIPPGADRSTFSPSTPNRSRVQPKLNQWGLFFLLK